MKIFDCFTFFNEVDLLEFRLKLLDKQVDYFVIAESNLTHSGQSKSYNFPEAKEQFKPWQHKIIYLPVEQSTEGLLFEEQKKYNPGSAAWKLENGQRNALLKAATYMEDTDMVLLSDLDEIPSPLAIKKAISNIKPVAFSMLFHYYFLNCQGAGEDRWWKGCIAATARQFKEISPQGLRNKRDVFPSLADAGWHFSFLGGTEKIKQKLQATAHTEYNKDEYLSEEHIKEMVAKRKDILKREGIIFKYVPLSYYPAVLQKVMKQYPVFLHLKKKNLFADFYYTLRRIKKGKY
jgi:beta-1,4-mannosyl-glycoprotein beta-1,4-N-acetylglucosaminyltransferase